MDLGHYLTTSHLIERHCVEFADQIALKDGLGGSMTWASMKDKIDDICSTLLDNNVTEGVFIGIYQEPSVVWICSLLAIWKVGAIYVPLDPRDSLERLLAIIEDCKPAFILTIDSSISKAHNLLSFGSKLINVSSAARDNSKQIVVQAKPYSVSTVLYTSGSTGKPKGIQLNHHGLLNHCLVYGKTHGLERERLLQQCAFSFDLCQDQVIIALAHGGSVYVASSAQRAEPALIARVIREEMITATVATPSEYHAWIKHGHEHLKDASGWKFAISGGESITHGLLRAFKNCNVPNLTLLNLYGPSEISIGILSVEVDYKNPDLTTAVPIGRPLRNYAAYIVDRNMDPVPIGVDGELIAAGAGVAQGYHNQPELTKEKFLPDNMTPPGYFDKHWNRLYKTGDMGRRQADGTILFKGRASGDTQVKLNGIRIELSAVENALVKASQGCLVGAICTIRDGVMVAHVEFDSTSPEIGRPEFLKALGLALPLPKYMTPGIILELEKIPLTRHGKADRKQIASLPLSQTEVPAEQSDLSASEMVLKDIWLQVLPPAIAKSLSITADSDFFLCGGNSLSIVNVQNLIRKEFKVSLPIIDLLEASELRSMATKIENGTTLTEIDWDDETKLEDDLIQAATGATPRESKRTTGLSVVLTGATGHLGGHFLSRLVQDDRVSKIHCVSVRRESPKPRNALLASSKIVVHWGDLADSKLGLSPAVYEHLARHADIIFHLGADRSFWDHYHLTKGPNFTSTKSLVQLSVSRHIPLHFISSAAVLDSTGETSSHGIPTTYPPTDGTSGYMASKWASEVYIEKAVTTLGLPLFIHRVTAYPGDSTTHADLSSVFLDLADKMKVIPDWEGWTGNFDVMEADALATDIINTAIIQPSTPSDTVLVTNHPCDTRVYLAELEAYMNAHTKDRSSYETCPPHEWAGKAKLAGVGYHFGTMQFQISNHETSDVLEVKR
jgi:hybrid polyketide synthase/nonribosomal peptide synthetase ACE1